MAVPSFDKAVAVFKKLFQPDTNVRSARLRFRNVNQGPDESNVIYLANLREAVETVAILVYCLMKCSETDLLKAVAQTSFAISL